MADLPDISCIIPVYNDRLRLPRAVASALAQGPAVQVVLVDDGSSDGSRELTLEMARSDPRVLAFPLPANRGQGYARNIGATVAEARNITFLDQDDEHVAGWYEHALGLLREHPDLAAVKGDIELRDLPPGIHLERGDPRWAAMVYSPMWNVVLRKVVYQAIGGFPTAHAYRTREGVEDITLMRSLTQYFKVAQREQVATRHYVNPNGATAYFLLRSRVVGPRIEFTERSHAESSGALQQASDAYQRRVSEDLEALRALIPPPAGGG